MSKKELDNLVNMGMLAIEAPTRAEFDGMVTSARSRLADSRNEDLHPESRFDLAYGAAHGFALAALRFSGYRSEKRFVVFQALAHTLDGLHPTAVRIFAKCHDQRNLAEYEGHFEVDKQLLGELIERTGELEKAVAALVWPED